MRTIRGLLRPPPRRRPPARRAAGRRDPVESVLPSHPEGSTMTTTFPRPIASRLDGEALLRILSGRGAVRGRLKRGEPIALEDLLRGDAAPRGPNCYVRAGRRAGLPPRPRRDPDRRRNTCGGSPRTRRSSGTPSQRPPSCPSDPKTNPPSDLRPAPRPPGPVPEKIGKFVVLGAARGRRPGLGLPGPRPRPRPPGRAEALPRLGGGPMPRRPSRRARPCAGSAAVTPRSAYGLERDGDEVYLVMEYIPGRNLSEVIAVETPLAADAAARLIEQVAEGLEAVHACGLVHRDIKPSNIVRGRGRRTPAGRLRPGGAPGQPGPAGGLGDAALHGPRAGARRVGADRLPDRRLRPGGDPLRPADRPSRRTRARPCRRSLLTCARGEVKPPRELEPSGRSRGRWSEMSNE